METRDHVTVNFSVDGWMDGWMKKTNDTLTTTSEITETWSLSLCFMTFDLRYTDLATDSSELIGARRCQSLSSQFEKLLI